MDPKPGNGRRGTLGAQEEVARHCSSLWGIPSTRMIEFPSIVDHSAYVTVQLTYSPFASRFWGALQQWCVESRGPILSLSLRQSYPSARCISSSEGAVLVK